MDLRSLKLSLLSAVAASSILPTFAFPYADEDLLLVFRKAGRNDVIYNLGPVTSFLQYTSTTPKAVTGWDKQVALGAYDTLSDGVQFSLIASTAPLNDASSRRCWVTDAAETGARTDLNPSGWQGLWSVISAVGTKTRLRTANSPEGVSSIPSNDATSYTFIMSNAGVAATLVPRLGGKVTFTAETSAPGTLRLLELHSSSASPRPEAKVVGFFKLEQDGTLTYAAAGGGELPPPAPPVVTSASIQGDLFSVTISTEVGVKYRLLDASAPWGEGAVSWQALDGVVTGTGSVATLSAPTTSAVRLFKVESFR